LLERFRFAADVPVGHVRAAAGMPLERVMPASVQVDCTRELRVRMPEEPPERDCIAESGPITPDGLRNRNYGLALVLSGGNALGAYQAGAYEALHDRGLEPDWVAGASAGATNGAVICGNPPGQRIASLGSLWRTAGGRSEPAPYAAAMMEEPRRTAAALRTLAAGHPGMFVPRHLFGPWWNPFANPEPSSLYDTTPLAGTIERLVDFELLTRGTPRFSATAVDIETGEDVCFDTSTHRLDEAHLRASSALLPAFSPVEVAGRLLGDAGISVNLPLDVVLSETPERPLLCIAVDLLPLRGPRPKTLGETALRMQDLLFAAQSRRALAAWQAIFDERVHRGTAGSVTILHIVFTDQSREVSGKAFDFSGESAAARWRSGHADVAGALSQLDTGRIEIGRPGLTVYAADGAGGLAQTRWPIGPLRG
jgi:NTE family protein